MYCLVSNHAYTADLMDSHSAGSHGNGEEPPSVIQMHPRREGVKDSPSVSPAGASVGHGEGMAAATPWFKVNSRISL